MKNSLLVVLTCGLAATSMAAPDKTVILGESSGGLQLHLDYANGLHFSSFDVQGREVENGSEGVFTGVKVGGKWFTSKNLTATPKVSVHGHLVTVGGIRYGGGGVSIAEDWRFTVGSGSVRWKIDRKYLTSGMLDDSAMPLVSFQKMSTWTGALLGTGGIAWCKLFDKPNATFGNHTDSATFWDANTKSALGFSSVPEGGKFQALRFTREPDGGFSVGSEVTAAAMDERDHLARYRKGDQDVWKAFEVKSGETVSSTCELKALDFAKTFGRGDFKGVDTAAVTELINTIGRIGVIDDHLSGTNGWYSGYACLHEPWHALLGIAIDDPNYTRNFGKTLDYERDHAIQRDGMVKSRWWYYDGDATPGTYDKYGFYEAQWGRLMDSQSSYVTDVSDQFDLSGDLKWVAGQKTACESALEYLLKRDSNHNHLVEMENTSHTQKRSSDWLDIVWASYENAMVNAQLYGALGQWARIEDLLHDGRKADYYRDYAAKLKASFNRNVADGGFWDPAKGWYVYWRDQDGSVHGNNLTLEVSLSALADGICDEPVRRKALLETIESKMKAEKLLAWPACMESYAPGEGADDQFPTYENGDIFLSWVEYGIRAYAADRPYVAMKYVHQIVNQYQKDGLAFQRYLRANGQGAGDDILAGNGTVALGLYRDIYGIQPKFNRLYLEPHLTPDLNGSRVLYNLRGQKLVLDLRQGEYSVSHDNVAVASGDAFGVDFGTNSATIFAGKEDSPLFGVSVKGGEGVKVAVTDWGGLKKWSVSSYSGSAHVTQTFYGLSASRRYRIKGIGVVSAKQPQVRFLVKKGQTVRLEVSN